MKKSLIALAVLAASGAAMAQSSVTLFGIVDTGVSYVDNAVGNDAKYGVHSSGNATSRLGLRGTEDLGGGLKAGFWLEGEIFGDTGNANGFDFKRESTVRLSGNFGEVRLGRETTPTFRAGLKYDLFGATGIGQNLGFSRWSTLGGFATSGDTNTIRANNMVSYSSPNFNGFTGNISYAFDEKTVAGTKAGRYAGGNVGYDNGPLSVTAAYGNLKGTAGDRDEMSIGASYNFGVAKVVGNIQQIKYKPDAGSSAKFRNYLLGVSAPVGGVGEVKAQYAYYDQEGPAKAHQLSLGYVHNLSKRTALYGTVAYLKNQDGSAMALAAKGVSDTVGLKADGSGRNQAGVQVGIRHAF
ncbi:MULTISPECIES: porin [Comamonas]|jgi:predicted porin|uniref:porin n=1 Tax=Comamonas TaxID=283 RepID=UPI0025D91F05|nr:MULTISPECIES: porin [Comamonas]MDR3067394.1 porin [Comamonas sp.]MEB5965896.1 porin [Comamonas testosteroni]